eukprot:c22770_g1_i1 orf=400-1596(-)
MLGGKDLVERKKKKRRALEIGGSMAVVDEDTLGGEDLIERNSSEPFPMSHKSKDRQKRQRQKYLKASASGGHAREVVEDRETVVDGEPSTEINVVRESCVDFGDGNRNGDFGVEDRSQNTSRKRRKRKKKKLVDKWGVEIRREGTSEEDVKCSDQGISAEDQQSREEQIESKKVCVSGMPYSTTEDDILQLFAECGTIVALDCVTFPDTGKFRGLAFVTFETESAAKRAIDLDGVNMNGRFLKIEKCRSLSQEKGKGKNLGDPPKKVEGCFSAYVGNLVWNVEERDIKRFLKGCKIKEVRLAVDKISGDFRGFGHVDFVDEKSLENAVKLDQKEFLGRSLRIAHALPKRSRKKLRGKKYNGEGSNKAVKSCHICAEVGHVSFHCPKKPLLQEGSMEGT